MVTIKTVVSLVRHGETEWNILGRFQGCTDIELSEEGIVQAGYLKNKIKNNYDIIYTSPLKRAVKTAEIIAESKGISPIIAPEIREINFGKWEGLNVKDIQSDFPNEFTRWRNDKEEAPICGGDLSIKKASERAKDAIIKIVKENIGKNIIVVAHGGIIKAALIGIFGWDMTMYHKIFLGNTSISKIIFNDSMKPIIETINDTNHLPEQCTKNNIFGI